MNMETLMNPYTGEVVDSPSQIKEIWEEASRQEKSAKAAKDWCKKAMDYIDVPLNEDLGGGMGFVEVQRRNFDYDKTILRQQFDQDELEPFFKIDKKSFESYLEEQDEERRKFAKGAIVESSKPTVYYQLKKVI